MPKPILESKKMNFELNFGKCQLKMPKKLFNKYQFLSLALLLTAGR